MLLPSLRYGVEGNRTWPASGQSENATLDCDRIDVADISGTKCG